MGTWEDGFDRDDLTGWQQVNAVWPDVQPYYPKPPVNRAQWRVRDGSLEVQSQANAWSYLLRGAANDRDYTLEFDMLIPAMTPDRVEYFGYRFVSRVTGEFEPCWETAAAIRYTDRDHFYRVQFGTLAGGNERHVGGALALWSPLGGFLQVVPYQGKPFTWRRVKVVAAGDVIEVWLDGKLEIHYRDTVAPVLAGRCGRAAAGTQFYRFDNVRCARNREVQPPEKAVRPGEGRKRFQVRHFLRQRFIFCNNEPIGRIDSDSSMLHEICLRPGYRPMLNFGLHWDQYDGRPQNYVDVRKRWEIERSGDAEFVAAYEYANSPGNVTCTGRLRVTCDGKRDSYVWEVDSTLAVAKGTTWRNQGSGLSFSDPLLFYVVPNSIDVADPMPCLYRWIVFDGADGAVYRHPILHDHVPRVEDQMRVKSDGGLAAIMYDPLANPALEFDFDPKANPQAGFWLCPWAYDVHFLINPYGPNETIPGGTSHRVKFRYRSIHGPAAKKFFERAKTHPYFESLPPRVVFTSGLNTFNNSTPMAEPHRAYPWLGGQWDQEVGHSAPGSMRLEVTDAGSPKAIRAKLGGSPFMGRFESRQYTITGWVKTENVRGKGAALFAQNGGVKVHGSRRLTGTNDWQKLELRTEILYSLISGAAGTELDGTGTIWLDDFEVAPLGR